MKTIIVDDEMWMLERFAMECAGLSDVEIVGKFQSPLDALEFAQKSPVELAFLDIEMPQMNGLELAKALKALERGIAIVFVTAYEHYKSEAFAEKLADGFLVKPYDREELAAAVRRARLISGAAGRTVSVRTFGSFTVSVGEKPIVFDCCKAKELFALLVDRGGDPFPSDMACRLLWPEQHYDKALAFQYRQVLKRLLGSLAEGGLECLVEQDERGTAVFRAALDCDLYAFEDGDAETIGRYAGNYMQEYSWAEGTRRRLAVRRAAYMTVQRKDSRGGGAI